MGPTRRQRRAARHPNPVAVLPGIDVPTTWVDLATPVLMETVTGTDALVFLSGLTSRLPEERSLGATRMGIGMSGVLRIALLFGIGQLLLPTRRKARLGGFDLDAEVAVQAHDHERREGLLRDFLRPPLSPTTRRDALLRQPPRKERPERVPNPSEVAQRPQASPERRRRGRAASPERSRSTARGGAG